MKSITDMSLGDGGGPDLQKLVAQYGGYQKIPREEWIRYDAELEDARQRLIIFHKAHHTKTPGRPKK